MRGFGHSIAIFGVESESLEFWGPSRLYRDELDDLASLVLSLVCFAVLPYLGPRAANEEVEISTG